MIAITSRRRNPLLLAALTSGLTAVSTLATHAFDTTMYHADFGGGEGIIQRISETKVIYCNIDRDGGEKYWACDRLAYQNTANGLKADWANINRTLELTQVDDAYLFSSRVNGTNWGIEVIASVFTEPLRTQRRYEGNWNTGEQSALKPLSKTSFEYCYRDRCWLTRHKRNNQKVYTIGKVIEFHSNWNGSEVVHIVPLPSDQAVMTNFRTNGRRFFASMTLQPFAFANDAQCVQAHLNALGYDVGKADGALGKKSHSGADRFKSDQNIQLPALTKQTASEWCQALKQDGRVKDLDVSHYLNGAKN